jgi:predicted cobalt transporter CbtA
MLTPAQLFNQNSYLVAALVIFAIGFGLVVARFRQSRFAWLALIAFVAMLLVANRVFSIGASEIESVAAFDALLAARQPVVLEFYSDY